MTDFWNQKYATKEYLYGTKPNLFFSEELAKLKIGKLLLPAEGEGRNAVFAAQLGWETHAFDSSSTAMNKAQSLAKLVNIRINYELNSYSNVQYPENSFDAIGLIFTHLPPELRIEMHNKYVSWLKPNGTIILETFSKEQLNYNTGGPKELEMLFSADEIATDFKSMQTLTLETKIVNLEEGVGHIGLASVTRYTGKKL